MIDKTDFLLYGGVVLAGMLVIFLGYRVFYKKGEGRIKNQVANKINDFYAIQDTKKTK